MALAAAGRPSVGYDAIAGRQRIWLRWRQARASLQRYGWRMIETFIYSLAGGILVALATGRVEQIAWKFQRLVGFIAFALIVGATAWRIRSSIGADTGLAPGGSSIALAVVAALAAVVVILLAPFAPRASRAYRIICCAGGLASLALACMAVIQTTSPASGPYLHTIMLVVSQTVGGLLLGSITVAWLLGHAYLTATSMTIAPLRHFSRMLSWVVGLRVMFALISVAVAWLLPARAEPSILEQFANNWLVLSLRLGVGLLAVAVFAYMVSDCVRLRATQSATGILYFGSLFAYVGELSSQYLIRECGWPL